MAQTYGSAGQNWSSTYAFASETRKSLTLQQAQIIRDAEAAPQAGPQTTYNVSNDNRSNYVQVDTDGDVTTDYQIGDEIGQQTYAVGSINTGSTSITTEGDGNTIRADNLAENTGCIDGSLFSASSQTQAAETDTTVAPRSALDLADALATAALGGCR